MIDWRCAFYIKDTDDQHWAMWMDDHTRVEGCPTYFSRGSVALWLSHYGEKAFHDKMEKIILTDSIDDQGKR